MLNEMGFHQVLVFQLSSWPLLPWDVSSLPHMSVGWFEVDQLSLRHAACFVAVFIVTISVFGAVH